MSVISMKQLLEAGVHFGHQTRRWNPKMAPYIYTERNGIYIIDLQKSVGKVDEAYNAVKDIYIPQSKTYVYEEGEEIKGFISILNDDFIGALFVSLNEQGKGIGSKLIEYANAKFNNLKLAVYKQNQKSVHFYIKKGFEILSEEINEDSGFEEYIMVYK